MTTQPLSASSPAPVVSLAEEYADIVRHLASLETQERVTFLPHLLERAPPLDIGDVVDRASSKAAPAEGSKRDASELLGKGPDTTMASLRRQKLRSFSLSLLTPRPVLNRLKILDVGDNELSDLPGLSCLCNLEELVLSRNWFGTLPTEIGSLSLLRSVDASRNFLRPSAESLLFPALRGLPTLRTLDLSYNQKCGTQLHVDRIRAEVPGLADVRATLWEKISSVPGAYVGASAAERDATLLRSQLEPWGTVQLRRRLVADFGEEPTDPAAVGRADVMARLLERYRRECEDGADGGGGALPGTRRVVRVRGTPVRPDLRGMLLAELRAWRGDRARGGNAKGRERTSIRAECYMILRAPDAAGHKLAGQVHDPSTRKSRRAARIAEKLRRNRRLWDLAQEAMRDVDPTFASRCTEMAVTYGFVGSPHIDKQNCGPFYGLALGDFAEGTGGVCVECSARVVAVVDTRNRLGRIDGRYPHWVCPYDASEERFSLIYYETGGKFVTPGPPIFFLPTHCEQNDGSVQKDAASTCTE